MIKENTSTKCSNCLNITEEDLFLFFKYLLFASKKPMESILTRNIISLNPEPECINRAVIPVDVLFNHLKTGIYNYRCTFNSGISFEEKINRVGYVNNCQFYSNIVFNDNNLTLLSRDLTIKTDLYASASGCLQSFELFKHSFEDFFSSVINSLQKTYPGYSFSVTINMPAIKTCSAFNNDIKSGFNADRNTSIPVNIPERLKNIIQNRSLTIIKSEKQNINEYQFKPKPLIKAFKETIMKNKTIPESLLKVMNNE